MAKSVLLNFPPPWAPAAPSLSSSRRPLPTDADTELVLGLDVGAGNGSNGDAGPASSARSVTRSAWRFRRSPGTWPTATVIPAPKYRRPDSAPEGFPRPVGDVCGYQERLSHPAGFLGRDVPIAVAVVEADLRATVVLRDLHVGARGPRLDDAGAARLRRPLVGVVSLQHGLCWTVVLMPRPPR